MIYAVYLQVYHVLCLTYHQNAACFSKFRIFTLKHLYFQSLIVIRNSLLIWIILLKLLILIKNLKLRENKLTVKFSFIFDYDEITYAPGKLKNHTN